MNKQHRIYGLMCAVLLISPGVFAETGFSIDGHPGFVALQIAMLEEFEGGDLLLAVHRNRQTMTVYNGSPESIVNGKAETYDVRVTTQVVTNAQAAQGQNKNAMQRNSTVLEGDKAFYPTQMPAGTYTLDYSKTGGATGAALHIKASVPTKKKNGDMVNMSDFYVHDTKVDNTWGCVGVKDNNIQKIMNSYAHATGPKKLTINSYATPDRWASKPASTTTAAKKTITVKAPSSTKKKFKFW